MTETAEIVGQRDRSPAYPNITLKQALDRLGEFDVHFKRSPARPEKVGEAWGIKGKAYVDRTAAALRYFGLLEYQGSGSARQIVISEEGRKYLRAQQEETKREVVKTAALRPKQISKFWAVWGPDRPADPACLDDLVFKNGFSDAGARDFLKVYDSTIAYACLSEPDKTSASSGVAPERDAAQEEEEDHVDQPHAAAQPAKAPFPPFPAMVELPEGKNVYNVAMYSDLEGSRVRIAADLDLKGAKHLAKLLATRIAMMEEEASGEDE